MAVPKIVWENSPRETKKDTSLQDKKTIEALKERLNGKIQKDPKLAKKAALIIEQWMQKKPSR